jgi:NAD(P)-dependent dehydrogenase (short-subunit alcohol dehydrogenase family)
MEKVEDAVVVITGSTGGIGEAVAYRFANEGAVVVINGRSEAAGEDVVNKITENGGTAIFVRADMRNPDDIQKLISKTVDSFNQIDILINNAAVQTDTSVIDATLEDWTRLVETNFRAYWLTVKYAIEHMPRGSSVINVSSNHAHHTMPRHFPYNAIKAGIEGMTRAMALDLGKLGIRVNSITPGWIRVERTEQELTPEEERHLENIHPLGRIGKPEDVAGTAFWLASDDAAFVTGTSILVDGGRGAVMQDDRLADY